MPKLSGLRRRPSHTTTQPRVTTPLRPPPSGTTLIWAAMRSAMPSKCEIAANWQPVAPSGDTAPP
jgi:hypothetical protein